MKTQYLYILLLFILFWQSCAKENSSCCDPQKTYYFTLTEFALKQTPYFTNPAFDTISFASDKGDTLSFVKTKTDTTWYCEPRSNNPDNNSQNCFQILKNTYTTIKGTGNLEVKHWKKYGGIDDIVRIRFNNNDLFFGGDQIGDSRYWTFKKMVLLSNKIFDDAIIIYPNDIDSSIAEGYINKDFGLFYYIDKISDSNFIIQK
jgi:hypothetical protein